ncbi:hypothetical protein [Haliscomenobacter sp.]|uniref:hypothetical protein n=1 Tax=Haliscomenobacter sp. TaxID=2717303 RepID=UPI003BA8AEC5
MNTKASFSRKMDLPVFLMITACLFCACDCHQNVSGTVLDTRTKKTIDSVYVQIAGKTNIYTFTDSTGNFRLDNISGGFSCPPMPLALTKSGYEIKILEIKNAAHDTIFLERIH